MKHAEEIRTEIELTIAAMSTAPADESGYLVGKLAALLWVRGDLLRTDAHEEARRHWKEAQAQGDWLTDLLDEVRTKNKS